MSKHLIALALLGFILGSVWAEDKPKGEKVEYETYGTYFEKNTSKLIGDNSYLAIGDQSRFDTIFGSGFTMGPKPKLIPKDTFDKKLVVATIKRGTCAYEYTVESVTAEKGTLYVAYKAKAGKESPNAKFATPLVLTVEKGKLEKVVFIENGKEVGTVEIGK